MNTLGPTYETTLAQAVKHFHAGRLAEAHQLCLQLLAMDRNQPDGLRLMGLLMFRAGHLPAAVQWLGKALSFRPDAGDFHADLARVFRAMGDQTAAVASFRRALQNNPTDLAATRVELSAVHFSRALVNAKTQKLDEAAAEFSASLELNPDHADAWYGLGGVLLNQGKHEDAVAAFRRLVALRPNETAFHVLAAAYSGLDDLDSVIAAAEAAARIAPLSVNAHVNLGLQLWSGGDLLRAREAFRAALSLDPSNQAAHSKLVYMQLADDSLSPGQILDAHREWGFQQTAGITPMPPAMNVRDPDRRLRIGYVSNNFRSHAVSFFVRPIIAHHDRNAVNVFCYSDVADPDPVTAQFHSLADHWRQTAGWSDAQLAEKIREDQIDILVELTGHLGGGRLRMLAHRPAPVQISYIGYQGTTGVSAVDYVLSDEWTDPPGQSESNYLETPWRLPQSFFVFDPPVHAPPVGPLPARTNGFVTFGAMNAVWKTTDRTLELWGQVMSEVPGSRIMMLTTRYSPTNDRILQGLGRCGIAPQRIQLVHRTRPAEFHQRFGSIDLCLDPLPFLGHTTTCDAAWMGCPTISLAGKVYAHRFGAGVMRSLGLADLVTQSPEAFVSTAAGLAHDLDRLEKIRSTLRATMHSSIITNAPLFTRQLEGEFRAMWKIWCNRKLSSR